MTGDTYQSEVVVIGAGVMGLAIGRQLALAGHQVLVLDRAQNIGQGISTRNSGVIHAGLYYLPGSLKARSCIRGRDLLYDYASDRKIDHRQTGKLIVAVDDSETEKLTALKERADQTGANMDLPLDWASEAMLAERAEGIRASAALWSPRTGIIDTGALLLSLTADLEAAGGQLALASPVQSLTTDPGILLADGQGTKITARLVINAAGLGAHAMARGVHGDAPWLPDAHYAKGHYFSLTGRNPFDCLIYPVPVDGGLGVHLTIDLDGRARFGPDVEWLDQSDGPDSAGFAADPTRQPLFEQAIRRYWPDLPEGRLQADYAGIRPKLSGPGEAAADFMIAGPDLHGQTGIIHCLGIESPGLTASLALAETVGEAAQAII